MSSPSESERDDEDEYDDDEDLDEDGEPDVQWYPLDMFPPELVAALQELAEEAGTEEESEA